MNLETITHVELQALFQKSRESPRKRAIKMFHDDDYDGPQLCLNVIQPNSYIRPHCRYTDESIFHYTGTLCSLQFNEQGELKKSEIIDSRSPYLFLPQKTIQSIVSLEDDSAIWMIVQGPHDPNKFSEFLPGTPSEKEEYQSYFEMLRATAVNSYHARVHSYHVLTLFSLLFLASQKIFSHLL